MTKRSIVLALVLWLPLSAWATDFALRPRDPAPGHPRLSYWWKFNANAWELTAPEKFALSGGAEIRLQKTDEPSVAAICRATSTTERDLLVTKKDNAARAAYFLTQLPDGITDAKLVSQRDNPLPVNGLTNFETVYSYRLGGVDYLAAFMVSRALPDSVPDRDKAPVSAGEYFTAAIVAPESSQGDLYGAFQQMLATAKIRPTLPDGEGSGQIASHGMLGR